MRLQGIQGISYSYLKATQPTQIPTITSSTQKANVAFGRGNAGIDVIALKKISELCRLSEINGTKLSDNADLSGIINERVKKLSEKFGVNLKLEFSGDPETPESKTILKITASRFLWPLARDIETVEFCHPEQGKIRIKKSGDKIGQSPILLVMRPIMNAIDCSINGVLGKKVL